MTSRVKVNLPESKLGFTPLILTFCRASMSESMYLLNEASYLDVNITNILGNTALHHAMSFNKGSGYSQLHKACMKSDVTVCGEID